MAAIPVFSVKNVSLLLEFANDYRIAGLYSRCMAFLNTQVDRATRCEDSDEAGTDLVQLLAILSKHRLEQHVEKRIPHAANMPTDDLDRFDSQIEASVMQKVRARKSDFWTSAATEGTFQH